MKKKMMIGVLSFISLRVSVKAAAEVTSSMPGTPTTVLMTVMKYALPIPSVVNTSA